MNSKRKLTETQATMLRRLERAPEMTPGGQRDSGRDASAWHRTLDVLVRRGFATRTSNGACHHAQITDAGREHVRDAARGSNG